MPTKNNNNRKIIRYEVRNNSDIYSEGVFKYLIGYCTNSDPQSYIDKIVKAHTLPLGLSLDHEHYRHVVIESLTFLLAQVDLIENISGISLKRFGTGLIQPSMVGHFPYPNSSPTVQPIPQLRPQAMGVVNPTSTQEEEIKAIPTESVLTPLQELEATLDKFSQQLADGTSPGNLIHPLSQLQPDDEEAWTEEMWAVYDEFCDQIRKENYETTFDSEDWS